MPQGFLGERVAPRALGALPTRGFLLRPRGPARGLASLHSMSSVSSALEPPLQEPSLFMQSSEAAWTGPPPSLPSFLTAKSRGAPGCPATQHHLLWPRDHVADLPGFPWLCAPTRSPVCARRLVLVHSSADGHLGCLCIPTTGKQCCRDYGARVSLGVLCSLDKDPEVVASGHSAGPVSG